MHFEIEAEYWGNVNVRLDNRIGVDRSLLKEIINRSDLPKCRLLLIFDTENGFPKTRGVSFPMVGMNYAAPSEDETNGYNRKRVGEHNIESWCEWDYAIYIPEISAKRWPEFEPYFTFITAHEIEHVKIMLWNLEFHKFASWIYEYLKELFDKAHLALPIRTYQFPYELYCHKKAKQFAILKYKEGFEKKLKALIPLESEEHQEVLKFILGSECDITIDDQMQSIHKKILKLCEGKKLREVIYKVWKEEKEKPYNFAEVVNLPKFLPKI